MPLKLGRAAFSLLLDELPLFLLLMAGARCLLAEGLVIGPFGSTDLGVCGPRTFFPADIVMCPCAADEKHEARIELASASLEDWRITILPLVQGCVTFGRY